MDNHLHQLPPWLTDRRTLPKDNAVYLYTIIVDAKNMDVTYDRNKSLRNALQRGLSFELAHQFDWSSALIRQDRRCDYGELRYVAMGYIGERLHVLVFTPRQAAVHVISLRKANQREVFRYESRKTQP